MKTMMAVTAGLLLVAGQTMAATSDIAATTAPIAHAKTANLCVAPQKMSAVRASQLRGRATNRCDRDDNRDREDHNYLGAVPLGFALLGTVIVGAIIYGEVKNHQSP